MTDHVWTVGVGKWRGGTLVELEADLARIRKEYDAPDDASAVKAPAGSTHALELIWIGPAT